MSEVYKKEEWGLFRILAIGMQSDNLSKILTDQVLNHFLELDYNELLEIDHIVSQTGDEGKQIHIIAEILTGDRFYRDCTTPDLGKARDQNDSRQLWDIQLFCDNISGCIDFYDIAKALLEDYKKKLGQQNKKNKKAA